MSVESSSVQSRGAEVLPEERQGIYSALFGKINLCPVSTLGTLDTFQDAEALADATAD